MIKKYPKKTKVAIERYLFYFGCIITGTGIVRGLSDVFLNHDGDKWIWFSRIALGVFCLGFSALIDDKR